MKLLEIKNNLVKLSYSEGEVPAIGRFLIISSGNLSYVAQFVNLKADAVSSYAIARLLFTFTSDGVVDSYDGSLPSVNSELSFLPSSELLNLLPIDTAIKLGTLSQQEDMLNIDISVFERNLTLFSDKDINKSVFVSNCVRQLFQMKEKCVIVDNYNLFEDYKKLKPSEDFKLPLSVSMMDYIFDYELGDVDAPTKAVIQDIFYEVQQYIETLEDKFLPINKFVEVVSSQYKALQMPELALLKNKLLKYSDAGVFANTKEEVDMLKQKLSQRNCVIVDIKDFNEALQKEALSYIHSVLDSFDKYIYFFVPLTDENSDKKLLKQFINHNHVFTTILTGCSYKYVAELREHAQNMILFAPQTSNHLFGAYNTFLNKLNHNECIVEGKLTQGVPFVIDMEDLDVDLTKDDVLGEKCQFVPVTENVKLVRLDEFGNKVLVEENSQVSVPEATIVEDEFENSSWQKIPAIPQTPNIIETTEVEAEQEVEVPAVVEDVAPISSEVIQPVSNIFEDEENVDEITQEEDDIDFNEYNDDIMSNVEQDVSDDMISEDLGLGDLTENDLNYIEENQLVSEEDLIDLPPVENAFTGIGDDASPVVPVYPTGDENTVLSVGDFSQGDSVTHPRYGRGVIENIINYGNKTLCSISFENVGRRLLDPSISELTKL